MGAARHAVAQPQHWRLRYCTSGCTGESGESSVGIVLHSCVSCLEANPAFDIGLQIITNQANCRLLPHTAVATRWCNISFSETFRVLNPNSRLSQARLDDDGLGLVSCVPGELMAHFCIAFQTMVLITQAPAKVSRPHSTLQIISRS